MKRDELSSKNHKGMKSKGDARWGSGLLEAAFVTICLHKKISSHMKHSFIISKNHNSSSPIHSQYLRMELLLTQASRVCGWRDKVGGGRRLAGTLPGFTSSLHKVLAGNQEYSKVPFCTDPGMDLVQLRPPTEQMAGLVFNSSIKIAVIWH